jgi:hypothetical protein
VDVTDTYATSARCSPATQPEELAPEQHGMDEYLERLDRSSMRRGSEVGVAHAEGFRQYLGHPFRNPTAAGTGAAGRTRAAHRLRIPPHRTVPDIPI